MAPFRLGFTLSRRSDSLALLLTLWFFDTLAEFLLNEPETKRITIILAAVDFYRGDNTEDYVYYCYCRHKKNAYAGKTK